MNLRRTRLSLLTGLTLGLAGCSVGPHLKLAMSPAPARYTNGATSGPGDPVAVHHALSWTAQDNARWWRLFHAPQLDALIAAGFAHSATLAAAQDALDAANQYAVAQQGSLFPSIGLGGGLQRDTAIRSVIGGRVVVPGRPFTLASTEGQITYNVDAFGLQTDLIKHSRDRAAVSAAELEDARIFLAGNIATAAITLAGDQDELTLQDRIVRAQTAVLGVMRSDYHFGAITEEAVDQQKAILASSKSAIPVVSAQRDNARHRLDYLIGATPDEPVPQLHLASFTPPTRIPLIIPSVLLEHRPDIVAATASVKAAAAAVDASTAAMYPNFNISGSFGAGSAVALFNPASEIFSLASSFAAPLFEGSKLAADKRASYGLWQQATAQYRYTVLLAFTQVADALRSLQGAEAALAKKAAAATFALSAQSIARRRYDAGAITYQTLLNAELIAQADQVAALSARIDCDQDIVALFVAMGDADPTTSAGSGVQHTGTIVKASSKS